MKSIYENGNVYDLYGVPNPVVKLDAFTGKWKSLYDYEITDFEFQVDETEFNLPSHIPCDIGDFVPCVFQRAGQNPLIYTP